MEADGRRGELLPADAVEAAWTAVLARLRAPAAGAARPAGAALPRGDDDCRGPRPDQQSGPRGARRARRDAGRRRLILTGPERLATAVRRSLTILRPPPELSISDWADANRRLSSEASAEPGQWRTSRAEYQRGIMDAISDGSVESVVIMSSSQVGKSRGAGQLPSATTSTRTRRRSCWCMPTERDAEAWSKDRFSPMARDTPCLAGKISDPKSRDGSNKILHKRFPGGHLTIVGANAPSGLASRPIRILLCDEVDRYPFSAGAEGDPVNLAKKRTVTFWNRKIVLVSTPTIRGLSRIETAYARERPAAVLGAVPGLRRAAGAGLGPGALGERRRRAPAGDGALPLRRLRRRLVGRAALGARSARASGGPRAPFRGDRRLPPERGLLVLGPARGDGPRLPLGARRRRRGDEDLRQHLARRDLDGVRARRRTGAGSTTAASAGRPAPCPRAG